MRKSFGHRTFTAVFLLLCLIPSLGMLLPDRREAAGSNEVLAAPPSLRDGEGALNPDYLTAWTAWFQDSFFLRQELVTAWSALNRQVLHTSIAEDVLLGRDGWLYFGGTLDDYTGRSLMSGGEIASAARNLALMSEYCESQGAAFLFAAAPNKNSLYPQHMPDLPVFSREKNAEALAVALAEEGVACLDLFAAFQSQEETLYFVQDSHWNSRGAALAADKINAALGRESCYFEGPFCPAADHRGDLYAMLYPAGNRTESDLHYAGTLSFDYETPIRSENDLNIRTVGGGTGSLLMFRDSFGNLLYPYLADSFAQAQFSRTPNYRLDQIAAREADCVVVELVERNLRWLIENIPVMPAPLRSAGEPEPLDEAAELTAEASREMPGFVLVRGTLPAAPDEGAGIYLVAPEGWYEAFRLSESGFGLYVPEATLTGETALVCTIGGRQVSLRAMKTEDAP